MNLKSEVRRVSLKTQFRQMKRGEQHSYFLEMVTSFAERHSLGNGAHFIREEATVGLAQSQDLVNDDMQSDHESNL